MPRGDGTGPMDRGPMTGRGAGFCVSATEVPAARSFFGRGLRRGAGRGRDMQIEALAAELGQVKQQLKELDSDKS